MIERDRRAFVAEFGDDLQRVFEPVVGEAVRVVTEQQSAHGTASRNCTSGKRERSSCSKPEIRNVIVAGQLEQVPPKRTWAMPSETSTTSSSVPSISSAGATSSRTTRATRSFSSLLRSGSGWFDVEAHLSRQVIDPGERPRAAQAAQERDAQPPAVQV